jgi:hypothetical protein
MDTLTKAPRPSSSPWHAIQTCKKYAPGIYSVSTAGHGGFMVHESVWSTLNDAARTPKWGGRWVTFTDGRPEHWLCYEEDSEWAILAWERPDLWPKLFEYQSKCVSPGADVCFECFTDRESTRAYNQRSYGRGLELPALNPVTGEVDGFGYCERHEHHVKLNRQMATDPRAYLLHTLSAWHAEYLLARGDEPEPEGFAYWQEGQENDRMRRERDPNLIVSAATHSEGVVKVHTADDKVHYVTSDSYSSPTRNRRLSLLSDCEVLDVDAPKPGWSETVIELPRTLREALGL